MSSNDQSIYGYSANYNALVDEYNARVNAAQPESRGDLQQIMQRGSDNELPMLWDGVGYPREGSLSFGDYWLRYERQGFARGIIDKPAHDTWQDTPDITDKSHQDAETDDQTQFEKEVERLLSGEPVRRKPTHRMEVADRLAQLGEYSIILLGVGDSLESELSGVTDGESEFDGLEDLGYIATFGQDRIDEIDVVTDPRNDRYRLPKRYKVIVEEADEGEDSSEETEWIHWTRVIHIPEGTLEDDLRGTPALKPIWNNLLNIEKILAGSAEGYWRGGYQGLVIRPPEGPSGPIQFEDNDSGELANEIRQWEQNYKRTIATTGKVEPINSSVGDPESHLNQQIKEISACKEIPQSILMGNESGERATTEDKSMWNEFIAQRRNQFADAVILRPFIQRLIDIGILPEPNGDGFVIDWPPRVELTQSEKAELMSTKADAVHTVSGGDPERVLSRAELRENVLDMKAEYGSEAREEFSPENPEVDELDTQMQEAAQQEDEQEDEESEESEEEDQEEDNPDE